MATRAHAEESAMTSSVEKVPVIGPVLLRKCRIFSSLASTLMIIRYNIIPKHEFGYTAAQTILCVMFFPFEKGQQ